MKLMDNQGRRINYLRLSVTDRCNMRCRYCMPADGVDKLQHNDILSYEQLYRLTSAAVKLGVEKVRVTGGEPLVRKGIIGFLRRLSTIPGLKQLVLTSNGLQLAGMAAELKEAGVQRLNISLDSLRPEVFARITRNDGLQRVLDGIAAAEQVGLPLKLNMVVMRGVNDVELADFAALTLERDISVRFIEYMPAIREENWQRLAMSGEEILDQVGERYALTPLVRGELAGPAREFQIAGARGSIGLITAISGHFCADCNRIRITASGKLRSCLFADGETDLTPLLEREDDRELQRRLRELVLAKPAQHGMQQDQVDHAAFAMASIGG